MPTPFEFNCPHCEIENSVNRITVFKGPLPELEPEIKVLSCRSCGRGIKLSLSPYGTWEATPTIASKESDIRTIGARFEIWKINSKSYGIECWKIFWGALKPEDLKGASLLEGNTAGDVYCIAVQHTNADIGIKVRQALSQSIAFKAVCGQPMFAESGLGTSVPLFDAGKIDGRGTLVDGYTCNARTGFDLANKEGGIYSAEKNSTLPAEKNSPLSTEKRWWEFWK